MIGRIIGRSAKSDVALDVVAEQATDARDRLFIRNVVICMRCRRNSDEGKILRSVAEVRAHLVEHVVFFDKVPDADRIVAEVGKHIDVLTFYPNVPTQR